MNESRRGVLELLGGALAMSVTPWKSLTAQTAARSAFVCPPCGCSMDGVIFEEAGRCPACGMELVERGTVERCCDGVTSRDIEFTSVGARLSGTLFMLKDVSPAAAIVLVHGSGPVRRMSSLARLLASEGFAVFTYDKRGVGQSQGVYEGFDNTSKVNLNLLAEDAVNALRAAKAVRPLSKIPWGYVGISQAGWIIPIAATGTPRPSFIGLWSGPVCTVSEEMHFSRWAENDLDFWNKHSPEEVEKYMQSAHYRPDDVDPRMSLMRLSVPGLWLFGAQDNSMPVALSIDRLKGLIAQGHSDFEYKLFPGVGHNLADSPNHESYRFMIEWIKKITSAD